MSRDPHPLTAWLLDELATAGDRDVVVVTTSASAAAAQRAALLRHREALLGVEFVTARGLAESVLRRSGTPWPLHTVDPLEEREALRGLLAEEPGPVADYAARFPGALLLLLQTIKEIENAGLPQPSGELGPRGRQVYALAERLGGHEVRRARAARPTVMRRAIAAAAQLQDRALRICVAGYPEPEGDLRALLTALDNAGLTIATSPFSSHTPAARAYGSSAHPSGEMRAAAADCIRRLDAGTTGGEIVIAVPRLGTYTALIASAFAAEGIPVATAVETPLVREPRAAFLLHLARVLFGTAPRAAWLGVAASPLLQRALPPEEISALEIASREHLLVGRGEGATRCLERIRGAPRARKLLRGLLADARTIAATGAPIATFSALLRTTADRLLAAPPAEGHERRTHDRLAEVLCAVDFAARQPIEGTVFVAELESLLHSRGLRLGDPQGVALVEYRDALSLPAAHLHLLGLTTEQVPVPPPSDVFLPDADRRMLAGVVDRDGARRRGRRELSRLLRHPTESLTLSRARTNNTGITVGASFALQNIERELGTLPPLREEPAHPLDRAARRVASGDCPRDQALLHLALRGAEASTLVAVAGPTATAILERSEGLERFTTDDLTRDGDVGATLGAELLAEHFPVGAFDTLGECPQKFLFRTALRVRTLPAEPDPASLPHDRLGRLVHDVLHRVYEGIRDELRAGAVPALLLPRAQDDAAVRLGEAMAEEAAHVRREFPGLFALRQEQWAATLAQVLAFDFERLQREGGKIVLLEEAITGELRVGASGEANQGGLAVRLRGRVDRLDRNRDGRRVVDYKTGGHPELSVDAKLVLRGQKLQLPLYAMLLAAEDEPAPGELEILSVRPTSPSAKPSDGPQHTLREAADFLSGALRAGLDETLTILAQLVATGCLPLAPETDSCRWCDYRLACRRLHPPSLERVRRCTNEDFVRYQQLRRKSARKPLLETGDAP